MIPPLIQSHIDALLNEALNNEREAKKYLDLAAHCREAATVLTAKFSDPAPDSPTNQIESEAANLEQKNSCHVKIEPTQDDRKRTRAWWVEHVMKNTNRPMRIQEMLSAMASEGHGRHLSREIFFNATYTAMKRCPNKFRKNDDGTWSLIGNPDGSAVTGGR